MTFAVRSGSLLSSNGTLYQPTLAQVKGNMALNLAASEENDTNTSNTTEGKFGICQHMQHMA